MAGTILTGGSNADGVGYAVDDILEVNQGGNTTATVKVTAIGGDTELAGTSIIDGGTGYTAPDTNLPLITVTGGGGGGTYNISTVSTNGAASGYVNHIFGG